MKYKLVIYGSAVNGLALKNNADLDLSLVLLNYDIVAQTCQ